MKPDKGNNNGNNNKRNIMGLVSIIFWALLFTMMIKSCTSSYANMGTVEVPYTTFKEWLAEDKIDTVNVENGKYTFTLRDGVEVELPREETSGGSGSLMNSLIPVPAQTEEEKQYITVPLAGVDDPELLAMQTDTCIISTAYDAYRAVRLIYHAMPISSICKNKDLVCFHLDDYIDDVQNTVLESRFRAYPILDEEERVVGTLSRFHLLRPRRKRVVLVDHNEATQAVEGFDQAEILEIIDHHRIGSLETSGPVYFRNQPVGCTATIITQMYDENGVDIPPQIAGLLLAAILSDTLVFRSPTCTPLDEALAKRLAKIAGVDIDEFASEMFEAGEKLDGKTAEEVFLQDFKVFMCGDIRFGVAQGSYMTRKNLQAAQALLQPYLEEARNKQNVEDLYMLLTDVPKEESVVICTGRYAAEVLSNGFESRPAADGSWTLPGVVSRKKQFIPAMMSAYQEL